ncbi:hypothetical protein SM100_004110 [Cronobacter sakazakii]|nr:hypothetical protein [Cronobacter sakazakii]ELY4815279.1 hypothetical protein [Cronobacter sakazakii]
MIKLTAIQYKEIIHAEERDYIEKTASGILGEYKDLVKSEEDLLHRLMDAFSYIKKLGFTDKKAISSFLCLTAFNDSFYLNPKIRSLLERPGCIPEQQYRDLLYVAKNKIRRMP